MSPINIENKNSNQINKIKSNNNNIDKEVNENMNSKKINSDNKNSIHLDEDFQKVSLNGKIQLDEKRNINDTNTENEIQIENDFKNNGNSKIKDTIKNVKTDLSLNNKNFTYSNNSNSNTQNAKKKNTIGNRNFNYNYNNYSTYNYHNSNSNSNNMDSVILLKIDNLPPGKNWKQIKYLIGGIIHHSNILKVKLLPIMTSIIPPFINFQSCVVTLKGNLRWEMINELIITINSYKWDYFDLYAYLLPNFNNTNTNNYNNNNIFNSNNNFNTTTTTTNFSNSTSTTTSVASPTILPSITLPTNMNEKKNINNTNDANNIQYPDTTFDKSNNKIDNNLGTTSTPIKSFDINSTNISSNTSSPTQNLNIYSPVLPPFPMMPPMPPNFNQPFIPQQQQSFSNKDTQTIKQVNKKNENNENYDSAYESEDEVDNESEDEIGTENESETEDENKRANKGEENFRSDEEIKNNVTNTKTTTNGLISPSMTPVSDSDSNSIGFPNSPPINPYYMYPTMSTSPNTANAVMANLNNNFGTTNNGYPFLMYPNNPMLPFPIPHENIVMPMQPGLNPNFNNNTGTATVNNASFTSASTNYNATNYNNNNINGNLRDDINNYPSNYSFRKRYSYHQPKFDNNNNSNNNIKDNNNKFKNYGINGNFDPSFFGPTSVNNANSNGATYSSRSNSITAGPMSLPGETFIPGSLPIPPIPMPMTNLNQNGNVPLQQHRHSNMNLHNLNITNPNSSGLGSHLPQPPAGNVSIIKRNTNPFKQPKKLKNIFNERNFRRQMTDRGMWQLKLTNFPPYLLPETQKLLLKKPLEIDLVTNSFDKFGKLRWTVLKDFIKLKCPKLLDLEEVSHIDTNGKTININNNTKEFYVGVYENQDVELNINLKETSINNTSSNEGAFYQMEAIYYNAIIGFHNKELKEICLEKLKDQEYSLGYELKVSELPPYNDDDFESNKLNDLNLG